MERRFGPARLISDFSKRLLRFALADFSYSHVFTARLEKPSPTGQSSPTAICTEDDLRHAACPAIRDVSREAEPCSLIIGLTVDREIVSVLVAWPGLTYDDVCLPEPRDSCEALITRVRTCDRFRKKGFGSQLLEGALKNLSDRGFRRAYSVVWHSNIPAIRTHLSAGFEYRESIIALRFRRDGDYFRFRFRHPSLSRQPRTATGDAAPQPAGK